MTLKAGDKVTEQDLVEAEALVKLKLNALKKARQGVEKAEQDLDDAQKEACLIKMAIKYGKGIIV